MSYEKRTLWLIIFLHITFHRLSFPTQHLHNLTFSANATLVQGQSVHFVHFNFDISCLFLSQTINPAVSLFVCHIYVCVTADNENTCKVLTFLTSPFGETDEKIFADMHLHLVADFFHYS